MVWHTGELSNLTHSAASLPRDKIGNALTAIIYVYGWVSTWMGDRLGKPSAVGLFAHRQWARYPFFPCIARSAVDSVCAPSLIAPAPPPCSQC